MIRILILVACLIGAPALSFLVATGVEYKLDSDIRTVMAGAAKEKGDADTGWIENVTLARICSTEFRNNAPDVCSTSDNLGWMKLASVLVSVIAILLVAAIWTAGLIARKSRTALLLFFGPGLYITVGLTSIFVVINDLNPVNRTV